MAIKATDSNSGFYECSNGHKNKMCVTRYHKEELLDMCFECGETLTSRPCSYHLLPLAHTGNGGFNQ